MQLEHINHYKTRLLIFFGGFYTDYNCFEEFDTKTSDILFVNDYSSLDFNELMYFDFSCFSEINLIAYSYGVWAANEAYKAHALPQINKSVGISGTYYPVHPEFGINPKVFNIMLNALSLETMAKFEQNMLANCAGAKSGGLIKKPQRSLENLRDELINIKKYSKYPEDGEEFEFETMILTKNDKIFSYKAQENFFNSRNWKNTRSLVLNTGHFPFFEFKTLDNILEA